MKWKSLLRMNGSPTLFEGIEKDEIIFCIERVGSAIYLQDMREDKYPYPHYNFDTVDNAKLAAKAALKGEPLTSNSKDPFAGLSDAVKNAQELLNDLKKYNKLHE